VHRLAAASALAALAALGLAGCAADPAATDDYLVLRITGVVRGEGDGPDPPSNVECDPFAPDTRVDPEARRLTLPDDVSRRRADRMDVLVWDSLDARWSFDCPNPTRFSLVDAPGPATHPLPRREAAQLQLRRTDAGLEVDGALRRPGDSWTVHYAYEAQRDGRTVRHEGDVTFEVLGPWPKEGIAYEARPQGFGYPGPTAGYLQE
jgi:hypothetical protein